MTNRERIRNCIRKEPVDRAPLILYFGPWPETTKRWEKECNGQWKPQDMYEGYDAGIIDIHGFVDAGPFPKFP